MALREEPEKLMTTTKTSKRKMKRKSEQQLRKQQQEMIEDWNKNTRDKYRLDKYAWIILQLPSKYQMKARKILESLERYMSWNVLTGEVLLSKEEGFIPWSNIVDILRHHLNIQTKPMKSPPTAYEQVIRFLTPTPKHNKAPWQWKNLELYHV